MFHPKMEAFDARMKAMFDRVDEALEERYAGAWELRRNRPARGTTANPEADGLFNVGVFFDPGFGPGASRGYLVEIVLAAEREVPPEDRAEVEDYVRELLERFLPQDFPERSLRVEREGSMLKIVGDLRLGSM